MNIKWLVGLFTSFIFFSSIAHALQLNGPLLPSHRIVAYYGNFYSPKMGVLGQYPEDQVIKMLNAEVDKWRKSEPKEPVIPAIDYIAVVAQGSPGSDGKYRLRMPDSQIQKAIQMTNKINGILFLDVQVGLSNLQEELPRLTSYLQSPNTMLAIDPEFSMKSGKKPGKQIGTLDASDINYAINFLAQIVREHKLPPKILIVHRFTEHMVTGANKIKPVPEVQVVMDMDGWGAQSLKTDSYNSYIAREPVEYTGIKLFYINDRKPPSTGLFTPEQIEKFKPDPLYILYQ